MANDPIVDLSAVVGELRDRVRRLEDIEALRNLKAAYAACDDSYDPDRLAGLFVEDATWESQGLGRYEGREAIHECFRGILGHFVFALHYGLNPQIEVTGDTARAQWFLFMPCTVGDTGKAMWRAGLDEEEYARIQGKWMYKSKKSAPFSTRPSRRVGQSSGSSNGTRVVSRWYDGPWPD